MRLVRGIPLVRLIFLAQVAILAGRHLTKLDVAEHRRLAALVAKGRGRPSNLSRRERNELSALVARLEPRLFAGSAVDAVSPLPIPKRMLYGNKRNPARVAADKKA